MIDDVTRRTPSAFVAAGRAVLPARRDPRGAVRLGVGARRARPPRRAAAGGRPGGREGAGRAAPRGGRPGHQRPRPRRRRPRPGAGRGGARQRRRRPGRRCDGDPFVALFSESAGRVLVTVPAADEERLLDLAAATRRPGHRGSGETGGDADRRRRAVRRCRCRWSAPHGARRCPPSSADARWPTTWWSPGRGRSRRPSCPNASPGRPGPAVRASTPRTAGSSCPSTWRARPACRRTSRSGCSSGSPRGWSAACSR